MNAGAGAVLDVDVTFGLEGGEQRRWAVPVVLPGDGPNFHLLSEGDVSNNPDVKGRDAVAEAFPTMTVRGRYEDVRGDSYELRQTLDIRGWWGDAQRSRQLGAVRGPLLPFYDTVQSMKDSVKRIADGQ